MTIDREASTEVQELTVWAVPRIYVPAGENPYRLEIHAGTTCYMEGAFILTTHTAEIEVPAIVDGVVQQVSSLERKIEEVQDKSLLKVLELKEQIAELMALPAPE